MCSFLFFDFENATRNALYNLNCLFRIENATKKVLKDVKKYEDLILGMFKISAVHVSISIHSHP